MRPEDAIRRYVRWYSRLTRLYPRRHRERFREGLEQTFRDLLRERAAEGRNLAGATLWTFTETLITLFEENLRMTATRTRHLLPIAFGATLLLLIPFVAMRFTEEVSWGLGDFVVGWGLLFGTGVLFEWIRGRGGGDRSYRFALGVSIATGLLLVWINLAVGILGDESSAANLVYVGVLAIGMAGALVARFRPRGMGRALLATALAQAAVVALVLGSGIAQPAATTTGELLLLNGVFVALWLTAAWLFSRSAAEGGSVRTDAVS